MSSVKLSLRIKLTLWFFVIFTVVFMGVLFGAWLLHRGTNRRVLDETLLHLAVTVAVSLNEADDDVSVAGLHRHQPRDRMFVVLAVRDAEGKVLASWWPTVDLNVLPPIDDARRNGHAILQTIHGEASRRLLGRDMTTRMVTHRFRTPNGDLRFVDLARASDLNSEEQALLYDILAVGAAGSLVASVLAAWLVAGRAVHPMKEISAAVAGIDAGHIDARIATTSDDLEVESLKNALNDALARLEAAYRAQEGFIGNIAHDLRTPITVMLAKSQVLQPDSITPAEFETYHATIIAELRRLGGLIDGLLTLARADQGEAMTRMSDVSLIDALLDAAADCNSHATAMHVRLVLTVEPADTDDEDVAMVMGDPDLIRTMFANIIHNAIRFSPPGEAVDIALLARDDDIEVSIRDRGPGIPEDYFERVFDRFVRAPTNPRGEKGMGLGLAIARSVANLHRGTIHVENGAERGCSFIVHFPPRERWAQPEPSHA